MRLVKAGNNTQSLIGSQFGLVFGVLVGFSFLRGTHHIAHFWPITIILSIAFECILLFRIERT